MEASCATLMTPTPREALGLAGSLVELKVDRCERIAIARVSKPNLPASVNLELPEKSTLVRLRVGSDQGAGLGLGGEE